MTSALSAAAADEAAALCAIYGTDADDSGAAAGVLRVHLPAHAASLRFLLPRDYPEAAAPRVEVTLRGREASAAAAASELLRRGLQASYDAAPGDVCIFTYVEWVREQLAAAAAQDAPPPVSHTPQPDAAREALLARVAPRIRHGEPLTERKSTFQAHLCAVDSVEEAAAFVELLLQDRKLAAATHNVRAYRIEIAPGMHAADCDDDGESAAGGRLLHLLTVVRARNVALVVSRWFGGTHLGADRFKLFNNAARALLDQHGFVDAPPPAAAQGQQQPSQQRRK